MTAQPLTRTCRLLGLFLWLLAPAVVDAGYTITDLGSLGGATSFAANISSNGSVTGNAQTPTNTASPRLNGFLWTPTAGITNVGVLPGSNNFSRGYAVNSAGVVVGESDNNSSKAFRYENGVITNLGTLGGTSAVALNINDKGQIIGVSSNGTASRAFLYQNGSMKDLGTIGGLATDNARAPGLSASGDYIAGYSRAALNSHATLWTGGVGGKITDLGALVSSANFSQAYAVNNSAQVVGSSVIGTVSPTSSTDLYHAFTWQNGVMTDLGTLLSQPTYIHSEAKGINNLGQIVGYVARLYNAPTSDGAAVLWQGGVATDLNTQLAANSGWNLQIAQGINDQGQIVGYGQYQGVTRAFLLTPQAAVPEPASALLLGVGGLLAVAWRRWSPSGTGS